MKLALMRFVLVAVLVALLTAFSASATSAKQTTGPTVSILAASYGSAKIDVLAGDTVAWHNDSVRSHTVSAADGSWASPRIAMHGAYSRRFDATGATAYYCQLHPFMRAEVDVYRLLLDAPRDAAAPGQPLVVSGRAALAAGTPVSIEGTDGSPAVTTTVGAGGGFQVTVTPRTSTSYRAVAGSDASPAVQVVVSDRKVKAKARARGRRVVIDTRVAPAARGAKVVLEFRLKERFGWWPVRSARLDKASHARFALKLRRPVRARVVLVAADGATPLARSAPMRLAPR